MRSFMAILGKELLSFLRSWGLVAVVLYSFTADIYIAGEGIQVKPRHVRIGYVDETSGYLANKILSHLHAPEFEKPIWFASQKALFQAIQNKEIVVGLVFDSNFERDFYKHHTATLNVLLDSTAAAQSFITLSYLHNIVLQQTSLHLPIKLAIHKLFNQNSNSKVFMSFTEMLSITTLLAVILSAVVFVKEKEEGTWDIMLLMPIDAKVVIFAKALSQVIIIMGGVILAVGFIVLGVFNAPLNGSFWSFVLLTLLYSLTSVGIGFFIAAVSRTTMQVAQLSILIMMPLIFLSGAWTPIYAMHPLLQKLSLLSPLRYYIEGSESIFFRGTQFLDLWPYFVGVTTLGMVLFFIGFRKLGRLF